MDASMEENELPYSVITLPARLFKQYGESPYYVLYKNSTNEILYSSTDIVKVYAYCFLHLISFYDVDFV